MRQWELGAAETIFQEGQVIVIRIIPESWYKYAVNQHMFAAKNVYGFAYFNI